MFNLEIIILIMLVVGYVFGSIPVGYLYCKARGVDIFKVGSGNPGSTNVGRVLGKKHGNIVFVLDIMKALVPIFIMHLIIIYFNTRYLYIDIPRHSYFVSLLNPNLKLSTLVLTKDSFRDPFVIFMTGLGAILGHNYPFTTGFNRGGKGISCTVAVIAYFNIIYAVILYVIHKLIGKKTGYVSIASILTLIILFVSALIFSILKIYPFNFGYAYVVLPEIFIMMALGIFRHRSNIVRLINGTENKSA